MNEAVNCLVIDDEPLARQLIKTFTAGHNDLVVAGECAHPAAAYELLLNNDIDVIFLDIEMPGLSGIDFLRSLKKPPFIIFTTAFSQHAAIAFDLNVVDYLVKPITVERFQQAIEKLRAALNRANQTHQSSSSPALADHTFFKIDGRLVKVLFADIVYLEALKDFTKIVLRNAPGLLVGEHLKAVEAMLPAGDFIRIHRSYTISLKAVTGLFGNTIEIGTIQLPVGASYKQDLLDVLKIT